MNDMDAQAGGSRSSLEPPQPGRLRVGQLACWLPPCIVLGVLVALAAEVAQGYFRPLLILFPLMVGVILGGMLVGLLRICHVGHRGTAFWGAILACSLAAVGQHYVAYWRVQAGFRERVRKEPQKYLLLKDPSLRDAYADALPPDSFVEFMERSADEGLPIGKWTARHGMVWLVWGLSGLLIFVPAVLLVHTAARLPYCNQCRKWYHTTRSGRIDPDTARQLAAAADVSVTAEIRSARYRLINCPGGCGPTGFSLSWEQTDGEDAAGPIWLGPAERNRIQEILDASAAKGQAESEENQSADPGSLDLRP
jgi:hypothetical protein